MRPSPETLAELERAHASGATINRIGVAGFGTPQCNRCGAQWPCRDASLLAYIRDLESDNARFREALGRALSRNVALAALPETEGRYLSNEDAAAPKED